jgi:hypothetical protein
VAYTQIHLDEQICRSSKPQKRAQNKKNLIDFFSTVRKIFAFFRKKSAKGVDNPIRVCHSLASSLNVFLTIQPSLKISQPIIVGTK